MPLLHHTLSQLLPVFFLAAPPQRHAHAKSEKVACQNGDCARHVSHKICLQGLNGRGSTSRNGYLCNFLLLLLAAKGLPQSLIFSVFSIYQPFVSPKFPPAPTPSPPHPARRHISNAPQTRTSRFATRSQHAPPFAHYPRGAWPHSGMRGGNIAKSKRLSVTLSVGTPLCPYDIAYCRVYASSTSGLFQKPLCVPLCGYLGRRCRRG